MCINVPVLSYGITAWGNASQVTLKRTNILQKRAIRTICRANYNSHTEPLFKKLNIMKLKEQYEYEAAILMYKFVHNKLPHFTPPLGALRLDTPVLFRVRSPNDGNSWDQVN